MKKHTLGRRRFLQLGGVAAAAAALPTALFLGGARAARPQDRRYLFVIGAFGGASIIDSFLPLATSEVRPPGDASRLVAYPDQLIVQPTGSNLRTIGPLGEGLFVARYEMETFLQRHHQDMVVMSVQNSSVNHQIAQKRSITGDGVNGGATIMEAVAARQGAGQPLPNCNMSKGGFIEPGDSRSIEDRFRAEVIADPKLFAASTHGFVGLPGAPEAAAVERARQIRGRLEATSHFGTTFQADPLRRRYMTLRDQVLPEMEATDLISKLMLLPETEDGALARFGFKPLSGLDKERLEGRFPRMLEDPMDAQGALAYLLARHDISSAVTLGPDTSPTFLESIYGTPLAFDYSHTDHVAAQHVMWGRMLKVVDGLIGLLKEEPLTDNPEDGTIWDRSLIYFATDFGRDKIRPAGSMQFSTGHHLNNGALLISPMLQGNRAWGAVDPTNAETFGLDGAGERVEFRERHVYSAIAHAMDVDFQGREDMSFMLS